MHLGQRSESVSPPSGSKGDPDLRATRGSSFGGTSMGPCQCPYEHGWAAVAAGFPLGTTPHSSLLPPGPQLSLGLSFSGSGSSRLHCRAPACPPPPTSHAHLSQPGVCPMPCPLDRLADLPMPASTASAPSGSAISTQRSWRTNVFLCPWCRQVGHHQLDLRSALGTTQSLFLGAVRSRAPSPVWVQREVSSRLPPCPPCCVVSLDGERHPQLSSDLSRDQRLAGCRAQRTWVLGWRTGLWP